MEFTNNKNVTDNDVKTFLTSKNVTLNDEKIQEVFEDGDTNNTSSFDLKKFVNLVKGLRMPGSLKMTFQLFDSDNDGVITNEDLRYMLSLISHESCTLQNATDIMKKFTVNDNGMIYTDFEKMMNIE